MLQIYTGNGKGKTTAALGLALRAAGAGKKVFLCQFLKKGNCAEHVSLKKIKTVTCRQFGAGCFLQRAPSLKDKASLRKGLKASARAIASGKYGLVIMDEVNVALALKLLPLEEILSLVKSCPESVELVLTGRHAHPKIIACADLVSRVNQVKHYFRKGVRARKGIEY